MVRHDLMQINLYLDKETKETKETKNQKTSSDTEITWADIGNAAIGTGSVELGKNLIMGRSVTTNDLSQFGKQLGQAFQIILNKENSNETRRTKHKNKNQRKFFSQMKKAHTI